MAEPVVRCTYTKLVPIAELKAKFHPKNPNVHPDDQLDRLAEIIRYQGIRKAAVLSNRSDRLTAGHGRIVAAERAGAKVYPVDCQDYENEEQEFADLVADNALNDWSDLNLSAINSELPNLGPDFDLDMLGIKDFVLEPADILEPQCDEDEVPEAADTRCKPGDVWQLGRHRLMCGDSKNVQHIDTLVAGEKMDMIYADPPYGMNLQADYSKMHKQVGAGSTAKAKAGTQGSQWKNVEGDDEPFDPSLILGYWNEVDEIFLWGGDYYCDKLPIGTFLVWDKNNGNENADKMIGNAYEMCWSKAKHKKVMARIFGRGTFGHDKVKVHPTQKPVQLHEWFFEKWGKDRVNIADIYGGSGSTLIACEKTNRRCFMMEIDPHYCDVILARWEKYTGKTAERLEEGANV